MQPVVIVRDGALLRLLRKWKLDVRYVVEPGELDGQFDGADVVLVPTGDDGFLHVQNCGAALAGRAGRIRVLLLPPSWAGKAVEFRQMVDHAPDWVPPPPPKKSMEPLQDPPGLPVDPDVEKAKAEAEAKEQELIDALARLDPIAYARRRKKAAEELGNDESGDDIPVGALDRAVGRAGRRSSTKLRLRRPICRLRITAIG
jgi:hypothetical protein